LCLKKRQLNKAALIVVKNVEAPSAPAAPPLYRHHRHKSFLIVWSAYISRKPIGRDPQKTRAPRGLKNDYVVVNNDGTNLRNLCLKVKDTYKKFLCKLTPASFSHRRQEVCERAVENVT
jgi:hypothetical protein